MKYAFEQHFRAADPLPSWMKKVYFYRLKFQYENSSFHCVVGEFRVPGISEQGLAKRNNEKLPKSPRTSISKSNKQTHSSQKQSVAKRVQWSGEFGSGTRMNSPAFQRQCAHMENQVMINSRWIRCPCDNAVRSHTSKWPATLYGAGGKYWFWWKPTWKHMKRIFLILP